jgi:hypothetical protein
MWSQWTTPQTLDPDRQRRPEGIDALSADWNARCSDFEA